MVVQTDLTAKPKKQHGKATSPKRPKRAQNPLLKRWTGAFAMPPFKDIEARDFKPALDKALREHKAEIRKISDNVRKPTFANTVVALEKSGRLLHRVASVFGNLESADSTPALQDLAREFSPRFAAHESEMLLDSKLFKRIDTLYEQRATLNLNDEDLRVLERNHLTFVRAGARLSSAQKARVKAINARLAGICTQFMQNVLKDEQNWRMVLDPATDLEGLPASLKANAIRAAEDAGLPGKAMITLARSSVEGFLTYAKRRDLREQAFKAWIARGANDGETDNRLIVSEVVALRQELAQLLGYESFAAFSLEDTMAKTPEKVNGLLGDVWSRAVKRSLEESQALESEAQRGGENAPIAPWDWRYYAERVRRTTFAIDESELRPYLSLDNMIAAAFDCARQLFQLDFVERTELKAYHPDVRIWEVRDHLGEHVGVFMADYFARSSKRSGAWMSRFRDQHKLGKGSRPIVLNVMNFAKAAPDQPALLSFDDAHTLFHEFGHALHGLLSDVTYPSISGTAVSRDFVELPSQLFEHWLSTSHVLSKFARHYETNEPMPLELIERLKAAKNFNQGFSTVEYTASAMADMALYSAPVSEIGDIEKFERDVLAGLGMPEQIVMRHRLPHFMHIIGGYAAGYYSYMWSEVMDADAFAAFEETGNVFDRDVASRLKEYIYSAGNARDPHDAYVAFRGRPPQVDGLLKKRGLAA